MRIAIDATAIPAKRVGAGNYILNLARTLIQIDHENEYVIFAQASGVSNFGGACPNAKIVPLAWMSRLQRILWEQALLPAQVKSLGIDILHSPHYTLPMNTPSTSVVTFHDMTFFLYPQMHQYYKRFFFRTMIQIAAGRANAIIADSESSRQDILLLLDVKPTNVIPVPLGVSADYHHIDDREALECIHRKYHLPERFLLYVGVLEPRKNLPALIRAYRSLVDRGISHGLVIVGRKGWMYDQLFHTIRDLDLASRVILTGYVPEAELPLLYSAADLFIYPSLYEGFGLPVLEAMACSVPVVTSNISSMPEIVGDAGILVDPRRMDELADAVHRILNDRDLHDELARKGAERSKIFTWERTAQETLAVYRRALSAKRL